MVDSFYEKRDVPGKGMGLVATQDILKGTRILCEAPVLVGPNNVPADELRKSLVEQVEALGEEQRNDFLSLHNVRQVRDIASLYCGIYCTNSLPLNELDGPGGYLIQADRGGIFLEACRINHACDENAVANWNEDTERLSITTSRDIHKDEEITIYYLPLKNDYKARRASLLKDFNFECSCHLCSLPTEERKKSDKQFNETLRLMDFVYGRSAENRLLYPLRELHELDQLVGLYNEQGTGAAIIGNLFIQAAHLCITYGDMARGIVLAGRARSAWTTIHGSDCMEMKKWGHLADDPSKYKFANFGNTWKTAVNEVPTNFDAKAFEEWLWKRKPSSNSKNIVDFRCSTIFPTIFSLPLPTNPDYYITNDEGTPRPKLHWCFFGEIVDLSKSGDSSLAVKDFGGTVIKVAFKTEDGGKELPPTLVQTGYTIAIINAKRYKLPIEDDNGNGQLGIHHDDEFMLKIFPISLEGLFSLNDRVQEFSVDIKGVRTCHGCNKKASSLEQCKACSMFWYCNKACQLVGWKEKGHKADCKMLKDLDLKRMFYLDWDTYDTHVQFPFPAVRN